MGKWANRGYGRHNLLLPVSWQSTQALQLRRDPQKDSPYPPSEGKTPQPRPDNRNNGCEGRCGRAGHARIADPDNACSPPARRKASFSQAARGQNRMTKEINLGTTKCKLNMDKGIPIRSTSSKVQRLLRIKASAGNQRNRRER